MRAVNKMDQKCLEHALGNALGPKSGPINAQICTSLPPVIWKVKAPTSPSKASKRAKSGTRIKVLVVLDGFYRGPTIELSPERSQQNVVLG